MHLCKISILEVLMLVMTLGMVSCADDDMVKNGVDNVIDTPDSPAPTEDQLRTKVTADLPAYVHSPFDEGSTGAALVKRLPLVTGEFMPDTRFALLKGSDFDEGSTLTQEDILDMARVYLRGGYIGLERPTVLQASKFLMALMVGVTTLKQQDYERTFGMSGTAAAAAARRSQAVERLNTRMENVRQMAQAQRDVTTRAEGKTDENATPHSQGENEVMSEMVIFNPIGYFMQRPFEAESKAYVHSMNSEGNVTEPQAVTVKTTRTPYISGLMADAVAAWLNDMLKPQGNTSAALRRANATGAINELMSACETFTYSTSIDARNEQNETISYKDRINMTVRSWNVHNIDDNKDFYYLQQDVKLMMGEDQYGYGIFTFPGNSVHEWTTASNYGDYNRWYGSFLSQYKTSMNLTGSGGTIKLEASAPSTENGGVTTQVMVMTDASKSTSVGYALGGTGIGTELRGNAGISLSFGTTDMTMFSVGDNTSVSALTRKANTNKTKVSWTYEGSLPGYYEDDITEPGSIIHCHEKVTAILVNDADVTQEICWSVADPTGAYTVNMESTPQTAALLYVFKKNDGEDAPHQYEYTTSATSNFSHTLLEPCRVVQTWRMYITIDEWMDEPVAGAMSKLESTLLDAFSDAYAAQFQVGDVTAESMDAINCVIQYCKNTFDQNYDVLQGYAQNLGIKKFSIYWRCDDRNIETQEPYVVEIPAGFRPDYKAQAIWCEGNTTLYFAYAPELKAGGTWDGQIITKVWGNNLLYEDSDWPAWEFEDMKESVTRVVFHESFASFRPQTCSSWFSGFVSLATIEGIEYLNTSKVTRMNEMFLGCNNLITLDLDGFDFSKVKRTNYMFDGCSNLTTIYCSQSLKIRDSSWMFHYCTSLKGAVGYDKNKVDGDMANPETGYFTWPENNGTVVTLNENGSNSTMLKRYEGQEVKVNYNRTLTAKIGDDGNYVATPFTVCLPYDLDLSAAVNAGQVEIYTLAAASVNSGQFTFVKLNITTLEAGMPYLLRVMKGSIELSAQDATIKATKPKSTKVYSALTQWRRKDGTEVGVWVGTFDNMSPDDAADESAFGLQSGDASWNYYPYGGTATIPAFRCYLSSSDIEQKTYTSRFTE